VLNNYILFVLYILFVFYEKIFFVRRKSVSNSGRNRIGVDRFVYKGNASFGLIYKFYPGELSRANVFYSAENNFTVVEDVLFALHHCDAHFIIT